MKIHPTRFIFSGAALISGGALALSASSTALVVAGVALAALGLVGLFFACGRGKSSLPKREVHWQDPVVTVVREEKAKVSAPLSNLSGSASPQPITPHVVELPGGVFPSAALKVTPQAAPSSDAKTSKTAVLEKSALSTTTSSTANASPQSPQATQTLIKGLIKDVVGLSWYSSTSEVQNRAKPLKQDPFFSLRQFRILYQMDVEVPTCLNPILKADSILSSLYWKKGQLLKEMLEGFVEEGKKNLSFLTHCDTLADEANMDRATVTKALNGTHKEPKDIAAFGEFLGAFLRTPLSAPAQPPSAVHDSKH